MNEGKSVTRFFNSIPEAALRAHAEGERRMQAKMAASASTSPRRDDPSPATASEGEIVDAVAHAFHIQNQFGLPPSTVSDLRARGIAFRDMVDTMIEMNARKLAAEAPYGHRPGNSGARIIQDERETLVDRVVDGLSARLSGVAPSASGAEFAKMPLAQIAEIASKRRLGEVRNAGAANTTSDFPSLLGAAAGKALTRSYEIQRSPLTRLCTVDSSLSTFLPVARITLSPGPGLELVNESGEVRSGTFADAKETLKLEQYARIFELSRPAFLSDDVGGFQRMISEWGRVSSSLEGMLIARALHSQTIADGKTLFHADHGNLSTSSDAIGDAPLEAGSLAMIKATSNDHIVGVEPRYLVAPAAKRVAAAKALASITPASTSDVNIWSGVFELLSSPHLDANSSTAWYLFPDPSVAQVLVLGYYSGQTGPRLATEEGFRHLNFSFRLLLDVGVGIVGTNCWKNPGT